MKETFPTSFYGSDIICYNTKIYYYNLDSFDIYCHHCDKDIYGLYDIDDLSDKYDGFQTSRAIWNFFSLMTDWEYTWQLTAIWMDKDEVYYHLCWSNMIYISLDPNKLKQKAKANQKVIKIRALFDWWVKSYSEFKNSWIITDSFLEKRKELLESIRYLKSATFLSQGISFPNSWRISWNCIKNSLLFRLLSNKSIIQAKKHKTIDILTICI